MIAIAIRNLKTLLTSRVYGTVEIKVTDDTLHIKIITSNYTWKFNYSNITLLLSAGLTCEAIVNDCLQDYRQDILTLFFKKH